jgi:tripartite-type tricarboxylate transporter receptor subunit TctC
MMKGGQVMKKQGCFRLASTLTIVALIMIIGWAASESWAAEKKYPTRPIQVVVAYSPGSTDTYLRPFIEKLPEYLGQPLSFVYKPGAGGSIGSSFVAKSRPDGYTLFGCSTGPVIVGPLTKEGLDFTLDSFAPLCRYVLTPMGVAVKADSPIKTLKDLVEAAKASPGKLTYSTSGAFGSTHFGMEMLCKEAGIKLTHVPCPGSAPAATALLGGHVDMSFADLGPFKPHIESGAFRLLGIMQKDRMKFSPNIPTFSELGYPVIFPLWYGLMAPKGVPKEVVETIVTASKKAIEQHRGFIEDRLKQLGPEISFLTPAEMDKENRAISKTIQEIFKDLKAK